MKKIILEIWKCQRNVQENLQNFKTLSKQSEKVQHKSFYSENQNKAISDRFDLTRQGAAKIIPTSSRLEFYKTEISLFCQFDFICIWETLEVQTANNNVSSNQMSICNLWTDPTSAANRSVQKLKPGDFVSTHPLPVFTYQKSHPTLQQKSFNEKQFQNTKKALENNTHLLLSKDSHWVEKARQLELLQTTNGELNIFDVNTLDKKFKKISAYFSKAPQEKREFVKKIFIPQTLRFLQTLQCSELVSQRMQNAPAAKPSVPSVPAQKTISSTFKQEKKPRFGSKKPKKRAVAKVLETFGLCLGWDYGELKSFFPNYDIETSSDNKRFEWKSERKRSFFTQTITQAVKLEDIEEFSD